MIPVINKKSPIWEYYEISNEDNKSNMSFFYIIRYLVFGRIPNTKKKAEYQIVAEYSWHPYFLMCASYN